MGCQSSLINHNSGYKTADSISEEIHNDYRDAGNSAHFNFSDFIKANNCEVYEQYHFQQWIHKTINSSVRWASHKRSNIERVVKILRRNKQLDIKIMKEINVLKKLDHPNIVKIHEYFIDKDYAYLIFQPIYGKKLFNKIVGVEENILRNLRHIMKQLLQGLEYCHNKGITHLGIGPENLMLVTGYKGDQSRDQEQIEEIRLDNKVFLKIVGFGDSMLSEEGSIKCNYQDDIYFDNKEEKIKAIKKRRTDLYKSPETATTANATKQDIWSCGILLQQIIQTVIKIPNFMQLSRQQLDILIKEKSKSVKDAYESLDLLQGMLNKDPETRWSAQQCINHNYFRDINKTSPWKITQTYRFLHHTAQQLNIEKRPTDSNIRAIKHQKYPSDRQKLSKFLTMYLTFKQPPHVYHTDLITEFYNLDSNKDGMLQYTELVEGLKNYFRINESNAEQYVGEIFENLDKNKNGCIEYSEFVLGTFDVSKIISKQSLSNLFREIDRNCDGFIDRAEIEDLIGKENYNCIFVDKKKKKSNQSILKLSFSQFEEIMSTYSEISNKNVRYKTIRKI